MKGKSMAERHIYGSNHKYKGSMDDDGRIYDAHHRFIGRVKNGTIYDDCNIPRGYIDSDGRVTDLCNIPTGKEFGENFMGWDGHGSGYVRNEVLGTGHGNDYGVFEQLDRSRRQKPDSYSYDNDSYGDNDEEDSEYGEYGADDLDDTPDQPYHRKAMQNEGGHNRGTDDVAGCFAYLVIILFIGGLIWLIL